MSDAIEELHALIGAYEEYLARSFNDLWPKVPVDPSHLEAFSVVGALLSRQVILSMQLARSPGSWNGHAAPLFLRAQTDLHITFAWILGDIPDRARKYVLHGLGEEKLIVEQYKKELEENPDLPGKEMMQELIEVKTQWINSQRHNWLVEVNLGHWAHLDTRTMAIEADCESLYKFSYKPFSQSAHSMWPHVSIYNSRQCGNPLHRYHLVPELLEAHGDPDFLYRSCKYVHRTYESLIEKFGISISEPMPLEWWGDYFSDEEDTANEDPSAGA